jgi:hypothetical protein
MFNSRQADWAVQVVGEVVPRPLDSFLQICYHMNVEMYKPVGPEDRGLIAGFYRR